MADTYLNNILQQPAALQATLRELEKAEPLTALHHALEIGHFQHIILTGMGSSYHALYPLQLRLFDAAIKAVRLETAELIHYARKLISPSSLVVAVSQSGQSVEVVQLLELTRGIATLVGVTNTSKSVLAEYADQVVLTSAGEEVSVSCKTYTTALAALTWLGDQLLGGKAQLPTLGGIPKNLAEYLSSWKNSVEILCHKLEETELIFLLGRGDSLAAANAGALIIKEAAHVAAEGMSSASFRHGPLELISPHTFSLVYLGGSTTSSLNARLAQDIRSAGGQVETVSTEQGSPPFKLPLCVPAALPIMEILPAQLLSLALAKRQGIQAGSFVHISKVTTIE